jgi:hypothetical protein
MIVGVNASIRTLLQAQIQAILSGVLTEEQLLGGAQRLGMFAPGVIQREAANGFSGLVQAIGAEIQQLSLESRGEVDSFVRQAVAVVDERTTPCCLGVHGQIVEMIQPFYTPNPPAWTDYQERPPFHDYCRTSTVLVFRAVADDDLTRDMRRAAALERQMREKPGYSEPHPANAFSRIRR